MPPRMFYHYTSIDILDLIQEDGFIKTSWPRLRYHPKGVYLTDLGPNCRDEVLLE